MKGIDVVVIGGGLQGYEAARQAAEMGKKTALIERRNSLGYELTACGQGWLENGGSGTELPLLLGGLKKYLSQSLLEKDVEVLHDSMAAGLLCRGKNAAGLLIGNKFGLQALPSLAVIDTEASFFAFQRKNKDGIPARYVLEFEQITSWLPSSMEVPGWLGFQDNKVILHKGIRQNSLFAEFSFSAKRSLLEKRNCRSLLLWEAQNKALELAKWLRENIEVFRNGALCGMAPEITLEEETERIEAFENYFPIRQRVEKLDTLFLEETAKKIRERTAEIIQGLPPIRVEPDQIFLGRNGVLPMEECVLSPFEDDGMKVPLYSISFDHHVVKDRITADILVAGMGTAGAMSALAVREKGIEKAAFLDMNSQPGGTSGVGQVCGYWHGYKGGLNRQLDEETSVISEMISGRANPTSCIARQLLLQQKLAPVRERAFYESVLCGVIRDEKRIGGVLAIDSRGLYAVDAEIVIDATGDGDVAFLGGMPYALGDPRDGMTQSFSQWGTELWQISSFQESRYQGDFDVIYNDRYSEYLRGVRLACRQNSDYGFTDMITLRESRRVEGDYVLRLRDILEERMPEDCVAVTQTPLDTHGISTNLLCGMGFCDIHWELKARIPYRCYLPRGIDGMLITAKAFSAARDAASVCRMNADLRNAGYMVGLAAAQGVKKNCPPRQISVRELQRELAEKEILPSWAFCLEKKKVESCAAEFSENDMESLSGLLLREDGKMELPDALARVGAPEEAVEFVKAWYGDWDAIGILTDRLSGQIASQKPEDVHAQKTIENPYWAANRCLGILAKWGRREEARLLVPELCRAADKITAGGPVFHKATRYSHSRIDGWRVPYYQQIRMFALAAERLADARLVPALDRLLEEKELKGYRTLDSLGGVSPFFCAYLELCLARAAARCGSRNGLERLIVYLEDVRYVLSGSARRELSAVSGEDFGMDAQRWKAWLKERKEFPACPLEELESLLMS